MNKKTTILVVFGFLAASWIQAQDTTPIRQFLLETVDSLALIGEVELKNSRFSNPLANQLMDSATIAELANLTRHKHPVVRVYAWAGLLQKKDVSGELMLRIVQERWSDMDTVRFRCYQDDGSFKTAEQTGAFFIKKFTREHSGYVCLTFRKEFTPNRLIQFSFDSLLLCNPPPFDKICSDAVWEIKPTEACYDCIRNQVAQVSNPFAVIYLAKFKKEQDVDLIINFMSHPSVVNRKGNLYWFPFREFQHPRFFQVLKDSLHDNFMENNYLRAVKNYGNKEAAILLDSAFSLAYRETNNWLAVSRLCMVLDIELDTIFADLYIKMLTLAPENTHCNVPDRLWECRADTLAALYEVWKNGGQGAKERATAMFPKYQKWLAAKGEGLTVNLVMEQIQPGGNYRQFQSAFEAILKTKGNPYFIEPLFALLEKEPLPENRFFLAKLLLELQVSEVPTRLEKLFAEKKQLRPNVISAEKGGSTFSDFLHHFKYNN